MSRPAPPAAAAAARPAAVRAAQGCTLTFDPASGQGVASGRIWANVECAAAVEPMLAHTCKVTAQVRFENCEQK